MTREELRKITEIRDGLKAAFWSHEGWRWAAKFDQFIADAEHALAGAEQTQAPDTRPEGTPHPRKREG
jgi:hypothetical protein